MLTALLLMALQAPATSPVTIIPTAIEAPTQPNTTSSSTVRNLPRVSSAPRPLMHRKVRVRVSDVMRVRGQEINVISGYGLVVGLAGTGDSGGLAKSAMRNLLMTVNTQVNISELQSKNLAVVWVEASMPSGLKQGTSIDIKVSAFGDALSIGGGSLVATELIGLDGLVYATASGSVSTGSYAFGGEGASATSNHPTVGMIARGGKIERGVPSQFVTEHGFIYLDSQFRKGSFGNSDRVAETINDLFPGVAMAMDESTVRVSLPEGLPEGDYVRFMTSIKEQELDSEKFARVVVNERTGVIVIGEGVRIGSGAVTKADLTVTISESPETSQPGPLSGGTTESQPRTSLVVEEENRALTILNGAANLNEVVEVLDALGVGARDMIQLLQAMSQAGMLHAEIIQL